MSSTSPQDFVPLEALTSSARSRRYWQSLDELKGAMIEESDAPTETVEISESSRRKFLSLMAGSMALAGLTGCTRQPVETIMPYVDPPEDVVPGRPKYYATAVPVNGVAQGVIVESHLGRPTKIERNPDHPASLGSTSVLSQACVMDLYDPDRAKEISYLGTLQNWEAFQVAWMQAAGPLQAKHGEGFRILTETVISPSLGGRIKPCSNNFRLQNGISSIRQALIQLAQRPSSFLGSR